MPSRSDESSSTLYVLHTRPSALAPRASTAALHSLERLGAHALHLQDLHDGAAEAAHGQLGRALHEDDDGRAVHGVVDALALGGREGEAHGRGMQMPRRRGRGARQAALCSR